jgi:hypothetical protein
MGVLARASLTRVVILDVAWNLPMLKLFQIVEEQEEMMEIASVSAIEAVLGFATLGFLLVAVVVIVGVFRRK